MKLQELLSQPEGKTLEFKSGLSSLKPILKTLVAFANTAGGTLIIGRSDDGKITGVGDVLFEEERIASAIADGIRPAMMPEIEVCTHEGKPLLMVTVPHWRGPFYLKTEGPVKGVYVRLGSTNRRAGEEILAELQRSLSGLAYDQMPLTDVTVHDLDMTRIEQAFTAVGRIVDERKLETMGLLAPHAGKLAVSKGGLILFGCDKVRESFFPDARASCARFRGTDRTDFIDRLDLEGSLFDAIHEVPAFIRRNTRMAARIEAMRRHDIPEYPEVAIREVLINAIAHTDYSLTGMHILIAIYSDRMEIQNPGMLPFGMTMEDFKAGVSKVRNRVIARIFRELGLMEEWGSGYRRVMAACQNGGYPTPNWQELGAAFRVTFYPHPEVISSSETNVPVNVPVNAPVNVPVNERQQWFLNQLGAGRKVKAIEISRRWKVAEKTAKRDITALKKQGIIEFVGLPKTGTYRLKGKLGSNGCT